MSLATKYRPKDFDSIVWQTFVKETLKQAVKNDKIVWAYLFCGPRWTWKTSTARILAKTINCLNIQNWNPCNNCEICKSFNENKLIDIIEIDAASHTWVDNIRDIIEKAQFVPNVAKYKVYIIDEFHMLSPWASNALLKILEEPPSFVKFILATTEIQKILETILSRCQRYDFKNIDENDIRWQLQYIAKNENIKIDEKSLDFLVKNSNWWLRNAIVSFEQYIVWNEINFENIVKNSGITDATILENFLEKLILKNPQVIDDFEWLISSWKNIRLFYKDLIYLIRDKILEKVKSWQKYWELLNILEILDETFIKSKNSMDEKVTLLSWILKIIMNEDFPSKSEKVQKNEEKNIPQKSSDNKIKITSVPQINLENSSQKNIKIKNDLDLNEVENIFWNDEIDENFDLNEVFPDDFEENNSQNSWWNSDFDKNILIEKIKSLWWKATIISAIKLWTCELNNQILKIQTKNSFDKKNLSNEEAFWVIWKALEEMELWWVKIEVL